MIRKLLMGAGMLLAASTVTAAGMGSGGMSGMGAMHGSMGNMEGGMQHEKAGNAGMDKQDSKGTYSTGDAPHTHSQQDAAKHDAIKNEQAEQAIQH
jgi:hypothetical protein